MALDRLRLITEWWRPIFQFLYAAYFLTLVDDRVPTGGHEVAAVLLTLVKGQLVGQRDFRHRVSIDFLTFVYDHPLARCQLGSRVVPCLLALVDDHPLARYQLGHRVVPCFLAHIDDHSCVDRRGRLGGVECPGLGAVQDYAETCD